MRREQQPANDLSRAPSPMSLVGAAVLGAVGGSAASVVRLNCLAVQWCFTQSTTYLPYVALHLPSSRRFLIPIAGAICATAVAAWSCRCARKERTERPDFVEYVEAAQRHHGRIRLAPSLWRTVASVFSIGSGATIGREGTMIQFGSAATVFVGRWMSRHGSFMDRLSAPLAVACGAAAAVAAGYQAPVAGIFFGSEVVLNRVQWNELPALAVASFTGWIVSRAALPPGPLYGLQKSIPLTHNTIWQLAAFAIVMGGAGPVYQKLLRSLRGARRLPFSLVWGGAVVSLASLFEPRIWGNGDIALSNVLGLRLSPEMSTTLVGLTSLLILRLAVLAFEIGTGTVGGVFTPTLFAGAAAGAILAKACHFESPALFAVFGMSTFLAATMHGPLVASCLTAELVGEWRLFPLSLFASVLSWQLARKISPSSLYGVSSEIRLPRVLRFVTRNSPADRPSQTEDLKQKCDSYSH